MTKNHQWCNLNAHTISNDHSEKLWKRKASRSAKMRSKYLQISYGSHGNFTTCMLRHMKTGDVAIGIAKRNPLHDEDKVQTGMGISFGRAILDLG